MGYLICKECGGYYELQQGESPDKFNRCNCGGELKYVKSLDNAVKEQESQREVKICSRCGFKNDDTSKFCSGCGMGLRLVKYSNRNSTWNRQSSGAKALIIIAIIAVFGFLLGPAILTEAGYYYLVYEPYQDALSDAKQEQIDAVNAYFKGPLATDAVALSLKAKINSAETPPEALTIDVFNPATKAWRKYQNNQINAKKDHYGRVRLVYMDLNGKKDLILKVTNARKLVSRMDVSILSDMNITDP